VERLGDILLRTANVPMSAIESASARCAQSGGRIGSRLILMGYVNSDQVARALAEQHSAIPVGEQAYQLVSSKALRAVPKDWCRRLGLCPLAIEGNSLHLAMRDPGDLRLIDELARGLNYLLRPYATPELTLYSQLERLMGIPRPAPYRMRRRSKKKEEDDDLTITIDEDEEIEIPKASAAPHQTPALTKHQTPALTRRPTGPADPRVLVQPRKRKQRDETATTLKVTQNGKDDLELVFLDEITRDGFFDANLDEIEIDVDITGDDGSPGGSSPLSVDEVMGLLEMAADRETIVKALLQPVLSGSSLGLLLLPKKDVAVGIAACGSEISPLQVRQLMLPLSFPSSVVQSLKTKRVVRATTEDDALQQMIATYLRAPTPKEACVAPVIIRNKVVNLVCVQTDRGFDDKAEGFLERITNAAADAYMRLLVQRRRKR